jgi:hypothetical protein
VLLHIQLCMFFLFFFWGGGVGVIMLNFEIPA